MNTQSILELSIDRYAEEVEENLLQMSDAYFYHKHFMLGAKPERDRVRHAMLFHNILCPDNCHLKDYLQSKIEGRLEDLMGRPSPKERISEILRLAQQYLKTEDCTLEEAIESCCDWNELSW